MGDQKSYKVFIFCMEKEREEFILCYLMTEIILFIITGNIILSIISILCYINFKETRDYNYGLLKCLRIFALIWGILILIGVSIWLIIYMFIGFAASFVAGLLVLIPLIIIVPIFLWNIHFHFSFFKATDINSNAINEPLNKISN